MESEKPTNEQSFIDVRKRVFTFIRGNVHEIVIVLVCLAFMLKGVADIQKTGATIVEIIGNGFVTLLFSLSICRLLEGKGFMSGEQASEYTTALEEYRQERIKAGKRIKEMDKWCADWTKRNHKEVLSVKLYTYGISYEDFINRTYSEEKLTQEQINGLNALRKLKTMELTTEQLMSGEFDSEKPIDYKKITKKNYAKKSTRSDVLSKVVLSLTLGYYTLSPFQQWNWSGFAWVFLQTALILGISITKYFNAYAFIVGDICAKVVDKTNKLRQFNEEGEKENDVNEQ
jgi:hypothetical protein